MRKRKQKAIIRWHNFNIEKEVKKHFRSWIMLFLPWRDENKLHAKYTSYADRYHHEIEKIKKVEDEFIHHEEEINEAFKELATVGPPQDAWDNIAPGTQESEEEAKTEGITDERPMAEEDIQAHIDQIVNERPQSKNDSLNLLIHKRSQERTLNKSTVQLLHTTPQCRTESNCHLP